MKIRTENYTGGARPFTSAQRRAEFLYALRLLDPGDFSALEWLGIAQRVAMLAPTQGLPVSAREGSNL